MHLLSTPGNLPSLPPIPPLIPVLPSHTSRLSCFLCCGTLLRIQHRRPLAWQSVLSYIQFPLFTTLALGIFYKRATALPAFIGLLTGSVSAFILDRFIGPDLTPYWWSFVWAGWAGGIITAVIIILGSYFTKPYSDEKLKGLCWRTAEEEEEEKPRLAMDWRLWSILSLVVGISLTLIFWLVL